MGGIFISYRRDDAAGEAGRLYDRLEARFGSERVFRDVDALEAGERFPDEIDARLARCDVLIALIGKRWRGEDASGASRLRRPDDFVRLEIATALRRDITVIPALLHGSAMPSSEDLPEEIRPLAERHAIELDTADFHDDVSRLIRVLEEKVEPPTLPERLRRRPGAFGLAAGLLGIVAALAFLLFGGAEEVSLRWEPAALSADEVRALVVERGFHSSRSNPGAPGIEASYRTRVEEGAPVVADAVTGLVWQRGGSGSPVPGGRDGARAHVRELNDAEHGGHDDWRLPTLDEALSLLRPATAPGGFHLDPSFDAVGAPFIWTADLRAPEGEGTEEPASGTGGWVVYYLEGYAAAESPGFNAYVRAVRTR